MSVPLSPKSLTFNALPPIFILPTHLKSEELHKSQEILSGNGGHLSYQASEARIFLGRVLHKKRAAFDLRTKGIWTEEDSVPEAGPTTKARRGHNSSSPIELSDSDSDSAPESGSHTVREDASEITSGRKRKMVDIDNDDELGTHPPDLTNHVVVLKLDWLHDSVGQDRLLPFHPYLVYAGRVIPKPANSSPSTPSKSSITYIRATPDHSPSATSPSHQRGSGFNPALSSIKTDSGIRSSGSFHRRKFGQRSTARSPHRDPPKLHRTTTSEYEEVAEHDLPPPPSWLLEKHPRPLYSCLRSTPSTNPNAHFIAQLTKIKNARLLTLDEIGVRAYSTSIAALSAYPYRIKSPLEITRLPGCDQKIASLWIEWRDSISPPSSQQKSKSDIQTDNHSAKGHEEEDADAMLDAQRTIPVVVEIENDKDLQTLNLFHEIWGVGPDTARKFYFQHGFKDLDDLVEFYWNGLTRVQQIGVKFYDEFQTKIPRAEVEDIAKVILQSARRARNIPAEHWSTTTNPSTGKHEAAWSWDDPHSTHTHPGDFVAVIVGGYRRGKAASGDVDVILTHRDETMTHDLIIDVVRELEITGWITHTLTLHTTTSDRGGGTLPFRAQTHAGHGFDSLDKALCVWQDPSFTTTTTTTTTADENTTGETDTVKNPNIHRRVDIIISSWKTIGCAVVGWSGGTTFQRDVRRWVKRERGWKFDSSGIRDRRDGRVLEIEGPTEQDPSDGWGDREKRLMEGMGIGWTEPTLRCTG